MTETSAQSESIKAGKRAFGEAWMPERWTTAPGRLELLGNHIDYSGGSVLAGAIDRVVAIGSSGGAKTGTIEIALGLHNEPATTLDLDGIGDWHAKGHQATPADYLRGVVAALKAREIPVVSGLRLAVAGNVPIGFGMSSSAALCVSLVLSLAEDRPSDRDIVLIAQEAEHRAGSPVGAMDQSASVAGDIILFNGTDVSWESLHPDLGDHVFAVAHSGVDHALSTSSYPKRVAEAMEALGLIHRNLDPVVENLASVDLDHLAAIEASDWMDDTLKRRVRHVVTEGQRVAEGVTAVNESNWTTFGQLMIESGRSSAVDYEISHPVVEELVSVLNGLPGVLGARMMGGGEGGPALALIERDAGDSIRQVLESGFYRSHPIKEPGGAFQVCTFGPGAAAIDA
jgi:galactokinase